MITTADLRPTRPHTAAKLIGIATLVGLIMLLILSKQIFTHVDAGEFAVIQYPNGSLNVVTQPGFAMRWFGTVEHFPRSSQLDFLKEFNIKTRFNDGAHGYISGSVRYDMPNNPDKIIDLYRT